MLQAVLRIRIPMDPFAGEQNDAHRAVFRILKSKIRNFESGSGSVIKLELVKKKLSILVYMKTQKG